MRNVVDVDSQLREVHELCARGRYHDAEVLCRGMLKLQPNRADIRCQYGLVLGRAGKLTAALQQVRQAVRAEPRNAAYLMLLAEVLVQAGQLDEAIKAYERVLTLQPNAPNAIEARGTKANLLQRLGRLAEAETEYRAILAIAPQSIPALINLGNVLHELERYEDAVANFRKAIRLSPGLAEAHNNLGNSLRALREYDGSIAALEQAILLRPEYAEAFNNLGNVYHDKGEYDQAMRAYDRALQLNPSYAEATHNIANVFMHLKYFDRALEYCARALALRPRFTDALLTRGLVQRELGQLTEAEASFKQALEIAPGDAIVLMNMSGIILDLGRVQESIDYARRVLAQHPISVHYQNYLLSLHYLSGVKPQECYEEHLRWAQMEMSNRKSSLKPFKASTPNKKLRIGYVSPDFWHHPVAKFIEPMLVDRDRNAFEITCYANLKNQDDLTRRFEESADHWRNITGLKAQAISDLIQTDEIDILVDLSGHTGFNQLGVFAMKPAPVQVTYLGYPDTTGLKTVDYRISDAWADPPGLTERYHTEQLLRLPNTFLCYQPMPDAPAVDALPAVTNGYITFGSFNNLAKISDEAIALWASVLHAVAHSRLFLKTKQLADAQARGLLLKRFAAAGINPERIELASWVANQGGHLAAYGKVDIALDTYPYHGTTTTCEALWMGAPVLTLAGAVHVSRVGVSILNNVGFPELVAETPEEFLNRAVDLARDLPKLAHMRATLRAQMQGSPLCDAATFVKNMESAYREIWLTYCGEHH